jgi:acetyl esterase/lipase
MGHVILGSPACTQTSVRLGLLRGWFGAVVLVALLSGCGAGSPTADPVGSSPPAPSSSAPSPSSSEPFERVVQVFMPPRRTASKGAVPLVVLVPGGTWLTADPSGFAGLAGKLAKDGAAVVTTTYRTQAEGATFPVPIEDVVCAVNESAARVAESGQEVGPVVIVGHSAGAQLAALAALVGDQYQAGCSSPHVPVDGLVGLAGPYDLVALGEGAAPLFDSSPAEDPETWKAASPINQVAHRPDLPVLLLHGQADDTIPPSTSEDFAAALEAAGHRVTLDVLPNQNHFQIADAGVAVDPIEDFVASLGS